MGQVNNWRDPVTYSKKAGAGALALGGAGLGVSLWVGIKTGAAASAATGAMLGIPAGPLGSIFTGVVGAAAGAATGAVAGATIADPGGILGLYGLKNYHPFTQYFQNQQLQQHVLDWQKQQGK